MILAVAAGTHAQSYTEANSQQEATERRIMHARALAAAGKLVTAAGELETLRSTTEDETVRDVARILLVGIYIEQPDYTKVDALLDETYKARETRGEGARRTYFALAGQIIRGARARVERYHTNGLNVADTELPSDAINDLERLRAVLESIVEQAKAIRGDDAESVDAAALLEDATGVRITLARDSEDRLHWQREMADARQRLVASETHLAGMTTATGSGTASHSQAPTEPAATSGQPVTVAKPAPPSNTAPSSTAAPSSGSAVTTVKTAEAKAATPPPPAPKNSVSPANKTVTSPENISKEPIIVGSLYEKATQKARPKYPDIARSAHVVGMVTVYLVVNEKGSVETVERTSGPELLKHAAEEAARRWKFHPTLIDGQPVRVSGYISFNFAL